MDQVEKLVEENMSLVPFIFNKHFRSYRYTAEYEEIMSWGYIGLVQAAKKFDPRKNKKFSTLATISIRNEMVKYRMYCKAQKRDIPQDKMEHLDYMMEGINNSPFIRQIEKHEVISKVDHHYYAIEAKVLVNQLLTLLNEREKRIIKDYYGLGGCRVKTSTEIGEELGVHRNRIHQIINNCLKRMRIYLIRNGVRLTDIVRSA